jgi:hypothetical protein
MEVYRTNPHISSDETLLNVVSIWGGESFPRKALQEAGVAVYGLPANQASLNLYRFSDEPAGSAAAAALTQFHPGDKRVFHKGVLVAVVSVGVGAKPTCLNVIAAHLKKVLG